MFWFTADEHYAHRNIIEYCNRPFSSIKEMDKTLIENHNKVVMKNDTTIHAGDFTLLKNEIYIYQNFINQLNGKHIFLCGSHDYWLGDKNKRQHVWEGTINKQYIVVCHYAMRTWARSHYNSWQLYGHSHGTLQPIGKQYDIGVDNNNFYPVSFNQLKTIMSTKDDNPNLIRR